MYMRCLFKYELSSVYYNHGLGNKSSNRFYFSCLNYILEMGTKG